MQLNEEQLTALRLVKKGGDVYCRKTARILRELSRSGLVEITKPQMYKGDGVDQVPFFGAIATPIGLNELKKKRSQNG